MADLTTPSHTLPSETGSNTNMTAYDASPHYVLIADANGVIKYANPAAQACFGSDLGGRPISEVLPAITPEIRAELKPGQTSSMRPPQDHHSSHPLVAKLQDGSITVFEECYSRRGGGCQALSRESTVMRKILSNIPQQVFWKDRDSVFLGCNENFAKMAGLKSPEDIVGLTDYDFPWSKEESDWYRQCDKEVMDEGEPLVNIEEELTQEDGTLTYLLTSKVPLKDKVGNVIGILGMFADVTDRKVAELKVRESEERFNELFSSVQEGLGVLDENENVQYCNPAFARMFDRESPDEIVGCNLLDFFPEDQRKILRHQASMRQMGAVSQYEVRFDRPNGDVRYMHVTVSPRGVDDSKYAGALGALLDITDRKQAEQALLGNFQFLETLLDTIPSPVYYEDLNGTCLGCNRSFAQHVANRPRDEVVGKSVGEISVELGRLTSAAHDDKHHIGPLIGHECSLPYADGKTHDVVLSKAQFTDAQGNPAGNVGVLSDITEMKAVETTLSDIVRKYTTMINTVPAALYVKDSDFRYTIVNDGFRHMPVRGRDHAIGKDDFDLYEEEEARAYRAEDARVVNDRESLHHAETSMVTPDGDRRWFSTTKVPLLDAHGTSIGVVGMTQDITESHVAREKLVQADKLAAIGTLAAGVAHEINNPIGFVRSNLNTMSKYLAKLRKLVESVPAEDQDEREMIAEMCDDFADAIAESIDGTTRVKNIVADLKSFSRVDRSEKEHANLNEGLESTLNIVWNELKYKCKVEKDYGDLPELYCVPNQLNQVFMNLLMNASHAIETEGTIWIKTWADEDNVWVSIKDSGTGIPREIQSKIFEPFFTTKQVGKGTGLGLSLTFDIIEKHGGTIEVLSEPGQGAEFRVCLPRTGVSDE